MAASPPLRKIDNFQKDEPKIRALALRLLRDIQDAEDLVHDAWVSTCGQKQACPDKSLAYFLTVTRNLGFARIRKRRTRKEEPLSDLAACQSSSSPDQLAASSETQFILYEAVERLPSSYRRVIRLKYFEAMSTSDIATELRISADNVRARLNRAQTMLRELLLRECRDDPQFLFKQLLCMVPRSELHKSTGQKITDFLRNEPISKLLDSTLILFALISLCLGDRVLQHEQTKPEPVQENGQKQLWKNEIETSPFDQPESAPKNSAEILELAWLKFGELSKSDKFHKFLQCLKLVTSPIERLLAETSHWKDGDSEIAREKTQFDLLPANGRMAHFLGDLDNRILF